MTCGIYKITNTINGKMYIGQSVNIEKRWKVHKYMRYNDMNNKLYRAMNKHGFDNFVFSIICEVPKSALDEYEISYIKYYDTVDNGYNIKHGGQGERYYIQTEEHKKKNSEALKINNPMFDPIVKERWKNAITSEEYKEKQSIIQRKRYESQEEREKQSISTKKTMETEEYWNAFWEGFDTEEVRIKRLENAKKQGKPIIFKDVEYYSKKELARQLGISSQLLNYRLENNIPLDFKPYKGNKFK